MWWGGCDLLCNFIGIPQLCYEERWAVPASSVALERHKNDVEMKLHWQSQFILLACDIMRGGAGCWRVGKALTGCLLFWLQLWKLLNVWAWGNNMGLIPFLFNTSHSYVVWKQTLYTKLLQMPQKTWITLSVCELHGDWTSGPWHCWHRFSYTGWATGTPCPPPGTSWSERRLRGTPLPSALLRAGADAEVAGGLDGSQRRRLVSKDEIYKVR